MQKLVWKNSLGDEIDLTSGSYGVTEWEGFSNTSLNIQSQQVPFQDGGVFLDALIEQRELSVTLAMQDNGNLEERYRMRRELIHILNPKLGEGYLIYTNDFISKRIKCVAQIPLFETHNSDTRGTPKASLSWTACEPYWEDLEETVVEISGLQIQSVENKGDVECGLKIDFFSDSDNFSIENVTEGKSIIVNKGGAGQFLINTNLGNKQLLKKNSPINVIGVQTKDFALVKNKFIFTNANFISQLVNDEATAFEYSVFENDGTENLNFEVGKIFEFKGYYYTWDYYNGIVRTLDFKRFDFVRKEEYCWQVKVINNMILVFDGPRIYSEDGLIWNSYSRPIDINCQDIIYVAEKEKYFIITRSPSETWQSIGLNSWSKIADVQIGQPIAIFYDSEKDFFVLPFADGKIYTSSDLINFSLKYTVSNVGIYQSTILKYRGKTVITVGNHIVFTSDYENWEDVAMAEGIASIKEYNASLYAYTGSGNLYISNDCYNWESYYNKKTYIMNQTTSVDSHVFDGRILTTIADNRGENSCLFEVTQNGEITISNSFGERGYIQDWLYQDGVYYVLIQRVRDVSASEYYYKAEIWTSDNCVNFTKVYEGEESQYDTAHQLSYANGMFVLFGKNNGNNCIYTSSDYCETWDLYTDSGDYDLNLSKIEKFKNHYYSYAIDSNFNYCVIRSENLLTWEKVLDTPNRNGTLKPCGNILLYCTSSYATDEPNIVYETEDGEVWRSAEINAIQVIKINGLYYSVSMNNDYGLGVGVDIENMIYRQNIIHNQMGSINILNGEIFLFAYNFVGKLLQTDSYRNAINLLSDDSDMSLSLGIGDNDFYANVKGSIRITYRQKYIGV